MAFGIARGLECPRCGGSTRTCQTGRANEGAIFVRRRRCEECGFTAPTVESWITVGTTSPDKTDPDIRYAKVMRERALRHNYRGINSGHPKERDTVLFFAEVVQGKLLDKRDPTKRPRPQVDHAAPHTSSAPPDGAGK